MKPKRIPPPAHPRLKVALLSLLATLGASPAAAATNDIEIPAVPLQSGTPYPAPNIMFILDDSGSMEYVAMPEERSSLNTNIFDKSYVHNTIYYNPAVEYKAWRKADGSRYTDGMTLDDVWGDPNLRSDHDDISNQTHTYFVPRTGITDYDDADQYVRYDIKNVSNDGVNGPRVVRTDAKSRVDLLDESNLGSNNWLYFQVQVPAGVTLRIETFGPSDFWEATSNLYVRRGSNPTPGNHLASDETFGSNDRIILDDVAGGTYHIGVRAVNGWFTNRYSGVRLVVSYETQGQSFETPVPGRTEAQELANFATWWSYHRTRMKVAKYAASEAFYQLGDNYRVGFDSIWNRRQGVVPNGPTISGGPAYPIPTNVDGGLFKGANRATWFKFLHEAEGNGGTPLHDALWRVGQYFSSDAPWDSGDGEVVSCRLNFAILTTDGYWNSRSRNDYGGNSDGTAGNSIPLPEGVTGLPFQYQPVHPFKDNRANTLADVAMHYWKRDLRTDLTNNVPTSAADRAYWQHMVTFGVSIGKSGERDPVADLADLKSGVKDWPDPALWDTSGSAAYASRIDDLFHATLNGHGEFVSATNPQKFVDGLLAALTTISERPGSASNVTANSTSFTNDTRVYQASYTSGTWTGELSSYVATSAGVDPEPDWQASEQLPDDYTDRRIWTWNAGASDGAAFPTDAQVTALDQASRSGSAVSGADNAAYIAGDRSNELINDGVLRTRSTLLGDIVDSSPIFASDSNTLFVGANDGMLHAFSSTGEELFAYVPGGIDFSDLASLSDPRYGQTVTHKYFVDGPITVSAKSQTPGKNYLVGALGRGGRGVFGLDVTTPASFDADDVLWEIAADSDMGMVIGDPLVVTLNDTAHTKAVVVGNGINSPDGSATLFVIRLSDGEVLAEIEADAGSANGLSAPRGWDDNGDGRVDYLYAGDLEGNLWKFDFTGTTKGSWDVANGGSPMFKARDGNNQPQPITAGLALARNPDTGDVWVLLGTGRFLSAGDLATTSVQSLYGIRDDGIVKSRTSASNHGDLIERNIVKVSEDDRVRVFEPWKGSLEPGKKGWFLDLDAPYAGERVVSGLRVLGTTVIASSIVPLVGGNSCSAGGTGYINALDVFTGTATEKAFFDINGDGLVNDLDKVTVIVDGEEVQVAAGSIDLGVGMPTRPTVIDKLLVVGGSTGRLGSVNINPQGTGARRVSWREIMEY